MLSLKIGIVDEIYKQWEDITWIKVKIGNKEEQAVNYNKLTGGIKKGDKVVINTTAVDLSLGTGGTHFVIYNLSVKDKKLKGEGHIIKLRYTPMQFKCFAAEEQESPYHNIIKKFKSLNGLIVAVGTLHSMLGPVAAMIKWLKPNVKITYIMTDGGALPLPFSLTVKELKEKGIIDKTITIGHSFGGDYECINIYTGLIVAKEVIKSDVVIITMGPGIVGTGTKYGFSGIEQGYILDAVNTLQGKSFAIPRISFKDKRLRHSGLSHHTITNLNEITYSRVNLILPILDNEKNKIILNQIESSKIPKKHNIMFVDGSQIEKALRYFRLNITTMGRKYFDDKEYFYALGATGKAIAHQLQQNR
ncbi:hypothetical protein BET03_01630 [Thermohalobacter berrensis]|uniref:DUF3866 domain-containing protein n=1 Tax=Thermohalobacter berrensis TaxID=99594 RepID=A0A419TAN9_9FIRM|nr:hypothetical protein BET03_01630 [Thermohalobacter berrensis]